VYVHVCVYLCKLTRMDALVYVRVSVYVCVCACVCVFVLVNEDGRICVCTSYSGMINFNTVSRVSTI
jgi:hypothetical protein